jgi:magnesium transporter
VLEKSDSTHSQSRLEQFSTALNSGMFAYVRNILNSIPPAEAAHLIESTPPRARQILWNLIDDDLEGEILQYLSDDSRSAIISKMDAEELVAATSSLETDDLADILGDLPDPFYQSVVELLDEQDRQRVEKALSYPEDSAGGLMNTDTVTVRADVTIDVVLRYLRVRGTLPPTTDRLFVVDRDDSLLGILPLSIIVTSDKSLLVTDVMAEKTMAISVTTSAKEVAQLFEKRDLVTAPVVDAENKLVGRITIDDVVDVIREEAEHSLMSMGGLDDDEETFAPVMSSTKRRSLWLGINLVTALIAAIVNNLFEDILQQLATVAILMTIVPSMGGVAGGQTVTLVIRALALNQLTDSNSRWLLGKELAVGFLNGLIWAVVIALVVGGWKADWSLGLIIAAAMLINMAVAGLSGVAVPLLLKRANIDPALASGVILTTITDVVGLLAFLGLSSIVFL